MVRDPMSDFLSFAELWESGKLAKTMALCPTLNPKNLDVGWLTKNTNTNAKY